MKSDGFIFSASKDKFIINQDKVHTIINIQKLKENKLHYLAAKLYQSPPGGDRVARLYTRLEQGGRG